MRFSAMKPYSPTLDWIDDQSQNMLELVKGWAEINSYTFNLSGLKILAQEIEQALRIFNERIEFLDLPDAEKITSKGMLEIQSLGQAIKIQKRPKAPKQILLMIHMDTVYPPDQKFTVEEKEKNVLQGPGVTDAKGGLAVMLKALEALERSPFKDNLGWTVFINPDEEIGSVGSQPLLKTWVSQFHIGLVFEPCLANGNLVGARKGSGNFTIVVRGRAAHVGRDYKEGRNAITVLAKLILEIEAWRERHPQLIVNVGKIEGGSAANVVPDTAVTQINFRVDTPEEEMACQENLKKVIGKFSSLDGMSVECRGGFSSPPKILTKSILNLYQQVKHCGEKIGLKLDWENSGGVSDGNRLAAWGLPNVDTMGVRGQGIHSPNEILFIDSLTERAKLTALFLMKWAAGDLQNI